MEYNINDNINVLYNYCYNKNNTNCLNYENIEAGNININNIKLSLEHIKYNIILQQIIKGKFKNMMIENDIYYYKEYSHNFPTTYKITFYKDQKQIYDLSSSINNDSLFSYLLSILTLSKKTKHILLPILNIDINYNDIQFIFDDNIKYKLKNKMKANEILNICSIQIKEHYYKQILLSDYLKTNSCDYKILLFQIIHTLAIIQNEYPTFRHNNLILSNIFIYCKNKSNIINTYDGFQNDIFNIPNNGFDIKIYNFENATINKHYGNSIVNPYYDIYTLFTDFVNNIKCSDDIIAFLKKYIPEKFDENNILIKPIDLLYNDFFLEYNTKIDSKNDSKNNTKILQTFMDSDNYSILGKQNKLISKTNIIMGKRLIKTDFINTEMSETFDKSRSYNIRFIKKFDLSGGALYQQFNTKNIKNSPFISKDNKETYKKRQEENAPREPPVLLEQKVYVPPPPPVAPFQPPPAYLPIFNPDNSLNDQILPFPFTNVMTQQPVQKNYTLNLPSVLGSYTAINRIYEDVLPPKYQYAATTIEQRLQLISYLRNTMIKERNGEELIQSTYYEKENTLLSYIKILKLNPYTIKQNIYTSLPLNFLIFNAGYPIRIEPLTKSIELGKESMGLNIRIYLMTINDYRYKHYKDENDNRLLTYKQTNVWRELKYYDYIKTHVIEKKVSPNFIIPILYKIDSNSKINWNDSIKNKEKELKKDGINELLSLYQQKKYIPQNKNELPDVNTSNGNIDSGRALILVTEAPTNSLIQWSSKIYEKNGTIYKQIASGHHDDDVWTSILFQIMYIFAVLQKEDIHFNLITLEDNFYIKDLLVESSNIGSWVYNINGIDYYIPNYGYIVLFDSKYSDHKLSSSLFPSPSSNKYKINSTNIFNNDNDTISPDYIINQMKTLLSQNTFGHAFKINGGTPPSSLIITHIEDQINKYINPPPPPPPLLAPPPPLAPPLAPLNIINLFIRCFPQYLNNKIGKFLTKSEIDKVSYGTITIDSLRVGDIVPYNKVYNEFVWVIITEIKKQPSLQIFGIQTSDLKIEILQKGKIRSYHDKLIPDQTSKGVKFEENYIFEKYYI